MSPESNASHNPNRRQAAVWRIARWVDNGLLQWGAAYARGSEPAGVSPLPGGEPSLRPMRVPLPMSELDRLDIAELQAIPSPDELNRFILDAQRNK